MLKIFIWLLSVLIVTSLFLAPVTVSAEKPRIEPHIPGLRPSQPHMHIATVRSGQEVSQNWAGYVVTTVAGAVSDVKGSWMVPALACSTTTSYAAFWDGIDGFSDNTVEQTGVLAECYHGSAFYYTWYEFYPANPVYITGTVPVKPEDVVYGEVSYSTSTRSFTVTLTDESTGATFSTTLRDSSAKRSSAEWIAEAPSSAGGILPLANFGSAYYGFDNTRVPLTSYATVKGATGSIGAFGSAVYELTMAGLFSNSVKAQPSALTVDGSSFTVTWKHS
jgi:hypothetical protein